MFRERILHWTRIFDMLTGTMSAVVVLAKAKAGSLVLARGNQSRRYPTAHQMDLNFQRDQFARRTYNETLSRLPIAR